MLFKQIKPTFQMLIFRHDTGEMATEVREKLLTLNCNILKAIDVESSNLVRMHLRLFPTF